MCELIWGAKKQTNKQNWINLSKMIGHFTLGKMYLCHIIFTLLLTHPSAHTPSKKNPLYASVHHIQWPYPHAFNLNSSRNKEKIHINVVQFQS